MAHEISKELANLRDTSLLARLRRAIQHAWTDLPEGVRTAATPIAVVLASIGGLFFPGPSWLGTLGGAESAAFYLGQLWQVVAATAGLSLAVAFFVLQGVVNSRSTAIRDAGLTGPFRLVVYLGVAALITIGMDLLGIGSGAPGGWAGTWATCIAGLSILTVGFVFAITLTATDNSRLQRRRIKVMRRQVVREVEDDARLRLGLKLLEAAQDSSGYQLNVLPHHASSTGAIVATRTGTVLDIDLNTVVALLKSVDSESSPQLFGYIGRRVTEGEVLLTGPLSPDEITRGKKIFKIGQRQVATRNRLDVSSFAANLHDETIQAIREARLLAYRDAVEAQATLILAIPQVWKDDFGQQFTNGLASSIFPLSLGPLDRVSRNLFEQLKLSLTVGVREVALGAASQPIAIADRAFTLQASGLVREMLLLTAGFIALVGSDESTSLVRQHTWLHFSQFLRYTLCSAVADEDLTPEDRRLAAENLTVGLGVLANIGKTSIDSLDAKMHHEVCREWSHVGEFWIDENSAEYMPPSLNRELASSIATQRDQNRFAVACWLVHRLLQNPDSLPLHVMLSETVRHYSSPSDISKIVSTDRFRENLLSDWVLSDLASDEVHIIDSVTPVLATVAILMLAAWSDDEVPLEPTSWMREHQTQLTAKVREIANQPDLMKALTAVVGGDVAGTSTLVVAGIEAASNRQKKIDDEALIAAPVSPELQKLFSATVNRTWDAERSIVHLLVSTGGTRRLEEGPPPELRLSVESTLQPKDWIINESQRFSVEHIAANFGRSLAAGESKQLTASMLNGVPVQSNYESLASDCDVLIDSMQTAGRRPSLLLHGWNWHVVQSIGVVPIDDLDVTPHLPRGVRGQRGPCLVAQTSFLGPDDVIILDSSAWGVVREWPGEEGNVLASVTGYDFESAKDALQSHPGWFSELESQAAKIDEIRRRVLIQVSVGVAFDVLDPSAARYLTIGACVAS